MPQTIAKTQLPNAVRRFGALTQERPPLSLLPLPAPLERSSSA